MHVVRLALAGIVILMLALVGLELGAWGGEKLGYVEMSERRGGQLRKTLVLWHRIARWGLLLLVVPLIVLIVLISS
jgi:hypothetical protein